jgi:hypothetical protein
MEAQTLAVGQEIDFSMLALFLKATLTVKIVMIMLIVMSFWSWAIIIQKHIQYRGMRPRFSTGPSGRVSRWMSCSRRSDRTLRGSRRRSLPPGCWSGGAVTSRTAG